MQAPRMSKQTKFRRCPTCWNPFVQNREHGTVGFYCRRRCADVHTKPTNGAGVFRICRNRDCDHEFFTRDPKLRFCSWLCFQLNPPPLRRRAHKQSTDPVMEKAYRNNEKDSFSTV